MKKDIIFHSSNYQVKTCTIDNRTVTYRAFEGLDYCMAPVDPIQKLNLYVPEIYYQGGSLHGYTLHTAPIFMPNTVGGFRPGPAGEPGLHWYGCPNSVFEALDHGYVVACAGIRGRFSGIPEEVMEAWSRDGKMPEVTEKMVGRAPALAVDMKAAIRYLRYNKEWIPGDTEKIITNGTSAGGALSAITGASGNSKDYEPYLEAIGAAKERDDIFAASCHCPIHNLENADSAYEWQFCGHNTFHPTRQIRTEDGRIVCLLDCYDMTPKQITVSRELKALFSPYLNSLNLTDSNGQPLTLDEKGEGSFKELVYSYLVRSAQKELDTHESAHRLHWLAVEGSEVEQHPALTIENGIVTALDWDRYIESITRMKSAPAFDTLNLQCQENEEFGTETVFARHFTAYSHDNSEVGGSMAEAEVIRLVNPTCYIGKADTAKHWRIRHGSYDREGSLAIPIILTTMLENNGYDVDFSLPWGLPHGGDYDLEEMFRWIDSLCQN